MESCDCINVGDCFQIAFRLVLSISMHEHLFFSSYTNFIQFIWIFLMRLNKVNIELLIGKLELYKTCSTSNYTMKNCIVFWFSAANIFTYSYYRILSAINEWKWFVINKSSNIRWRSSYVWIHASLVPDELNYHSSSPVDGYSRVVIDLMKPVRWTDLTYTFHGYIDRHERDILIWILTNKIVNMNENANIQQ